MSDEALRGYDQRPDPEGECAPAPTDLHAGYGHDEMRRDLDAAMLKERGTEREVYMRREEYRRALAYIAMLESTVRTARTGLAEIRHMAEDNRRASHKEHIALRAEWDALNDELADRDATIARLVEALDAIDGMTATGGTIQFGPLPIINNIARHAAALAREIPDV